MKLFTKKTLNWKLNVLIILSVLGLTFTSSPWVMAASPPPCCDTPPSFRDIVEKVRHSVVNVSTTQVIEGNPLAPYFGLEPFGDMFNDPFFRRFHGNPHQKMETHALGSGFIISSDGLILTNNHVVEKATEIKIKLETEKEYNAKVIGKDAKTDLALIQIEAKINPNEIAVLGNSDAMEVGDWVMAVGNPFGLGHTVTTGIISATGRVIGAGPYDDFLQTDAAINPGNSGGPLFNMKGEVIGINTAIVARGQGIGFAIPINMAKNLLPQLKTGKILRGWLGVMIQDISPEMAQTLNLESSQGALVAEVTQGSPAEKAGLMHGDVITQFDGKTVKDIHALTQMAADTPPGKKVHLKIIRDGKSKTLEITLGEMPETETGGTQNAPEEEKSPWGLSVDELTGDIAQRLGLGPDVEGVVITNVDPESPAADAGLRRGDVITDANHMKIKDVQTYKKALKSLKSGENLLLRIRRGEGAFYVVLKPPQS